MKVSSIFYCASYFVIPVLLFSCKNTKNGENEESIRERYFQLEKIGWKSKVKNQFVEDINFTAIDVPIQYYLLKDKGNTNLKEVDSIFDKNTDEKVIEFTFHHEQEKDLLQSDFSGRSLDETVKYMSFDIEKDFYIITDNDTIPCSGVLYERTYKITPYQKVMLFFKGITPNQKFKLIYNDLLFNRGKIKFQFEDSYTEIKL